MFSYFKKLYNLILLLIYLASFALNLIYIKADFYQYNGDKAQEYIQYGVNLCSLAFLAAIILVVILSWIKLNKICEFHSSIEDIDYIFNKIFQRSVNFWKRFFISICITTSILIYHALLHHLTTFLMEEKLSSGNLNVVVMISYLVESCTYVTQILLFNIYLVEVAGRYFILNGIFER